MKIFLVMGDSENYDSGTKWAVLAFHEHSNAVTYMEKCESRLKELLAEREQVDREYKMARYDSVDDGYSEAIRTAHQSFVKTYAKRNPCDPKGEVSEDTKYYIEEIEIE
jgi:hypothetical protein